MNKRYKTDLPYLYIILLAVLTLPRVVIHDLKLMSFDSGAYKLLAVTPLLIWLIVAVVRKTARPIYDFVLVGLTYGLLLGLTHQVLWDYAFKGSKPRLGGNLTNMSDLTQDLILRGVGFISSIMTGLILGLVFGTIAYIAQKVGRKYFKKK